MSDLRHLQRLLNELQPAFKHIIASSGPNQYSPVISMDVYGNDNVVAAIPEISATSYFGNPINLSVSGLPTGDILWDPGSTASPPASADAFNPNEPMQLLLPAGSGHAATLAESLVTVTATDTGTGQVSSLSFDFIGLGPDPTLGSGYPPTAHQLALFEQYTNLINGNPPAPQSPPSPHHEPIHYIEGNMPIGFAEAEYGGAWGHHKG